MMFYLFQVNLELDGMKKYHTDTIAVNRLFRKLERAIASGNHRRASILAKELAQLKISCSVFQQRRDKLPKDLNLNMYIEDKQAHQGPIPLRVRWWYIKKAFSYFNRVYLEYLLVNDRLISNFM